MVNKYIDSLFFTWYVMGQQNNTIKMGVPGFFDCFPVFRGVPECSGVPVFRCSGVPVFRCSGVPGFSTCPLPRGFVIPIRKSVGLFSMKRKLNSIYL